MQTKLELLFIMPPKVSFEKLVLRPLNSIKQKRGGYEHLKSPPPSPTPSLASTTSRASLPKKKPRKKKQIKFGKWYRLK